MAQNQLANFTQLFQGTVGLMIIIKDLKQYKRSVDNLAGGNSMKRLKTNNEISKDPDLLYELSMHNFEEDVEATLRDAVHDALGQFPISRIRTIVDEVMFGELDREL